MTFQNKQRAKMIRLYILIHQGKPVCEFTNKYWHYEKKGHTSMCALRQFQYTADYDVLQILIRCVQHRFIGR